MTTTHIPTLAPTADLAEAYITWEMPWAGDPSDDADCAARTAQTRALAAMLLAAPLRTTVMGMTIVAAGWDRADADRADAAGDPGSEEWIAALGDHKRCTLTADARPAATQAWCACSPQPKAETWVRYTRWEATGQVAHGYVCADCRMLTQTG